MTILERIAVQLANVRERTLQAQPELVEHPLSWVEMYLGKILKKVKTKCLRRNNWPSGGKSLRKHSLLLNATYYHLQDMPVSESRLSGEATYAAVKKPGSFISWLNLGLWWHTFNLIKRAALRRAYRTRQTNVAYF